jgi:hypothetical protein
MPNSSIPECSEKMNKKFKFALTLVVAFTLDTTKMGSTFEDILSCSGNLKGQPVVYVTKITGYYMTYGTYP